MLNIPMLHEITYKNSNVACKQSFSAEEGYFSLKFSKPGDAIDLGGTVAFQIMVEQ